MSNRREEVARILDAHGIVVTLAQDLVDGSTVEVVRLDHLVYDSKSPEDQELGANLGWLKELKL